MSYDIRLKDPVTKTTIEFDSPHRLAGGIRVLGGTEEAWLNVTYNYGIHFDLIGEKGIRSIYGMTGAESIPVLQKCADSLKDDVDENDYWNPTEGNAKRSILQLIALAKMRPDGIWDGD